jgi:hypothetical protein
MLNIYISPQIKVEIVIYPSLILLGCSLIAKSFYNVSSAQKAILLGYRLSNRGHAVLIIHIFCVYGQQCNSHAITLLEGPVGKNVPKNFVQQFQLVLRIFNRIQF